MERDLLQDCQTVPLQTGLRSWTTICFSHMAGGSNHEAERQESPRQTCCHPEKYGIWKTWFWDAFGLYINPSVLSAMSVMRTLKRVFSNTVEPWNDSGPGLWSATPMNFVKVFLKHIIHIIYKELYKETNNGSYERLFFQLSQFVRL